MQIRKEKNTKDYPKLDHICFVYAPINVKPEREGGGGGSGNPQEFDCGVYPQGGDFDQLENVKISTLCQTPPPPPLGLDTDRCITLKIVVIQDDK